MTEKEIKKKRLPVPYDMFWIDDDGMVHHCHYLTCENGCECEKGSAHPTFYIELGEKLKNHLVERRGDE